MGCGLIDNWLIYGIYNIDQTSVDKRQLINQVRRQTYHLRNRGPGFNSHIISPVNLTTLTQIRNEHFKDCLTTSTGQKCPSKPRTQERHSK